MRRRLVILAIPLIVGQLGAILQSFADTIMVGQYGTLELSASGFVNQVFNLVIYFLLGISYGATPVIGSMYGRGDKGGVWQTLLNSIRLGLTVSLAVVALLVLFYSKSTAWDNRSNCCHSSAHTSCCNWQVCQHSQYSTQPNNTTTQWATHALLCG